MPDEKDFFQEDPVALSKALRTIVKNTPPVGGLSTPQEVSPPRQINLIPQRGPQTAFFESPVDELLFGGAAGGSKSESLLYDCIALCIKHPKYRAILFRRTFPEIEKSLVPRVSSILYGYAKSRDKGMRWDFPNGSVLYLSHLQREDDKEKHKSTEYDWIGFDELTSFTESQYVYLFSRCRGATDVPRMIRSATNPTGIGHGWVKRRFLNPPPEEAVPVGEVEYEYAYGWEHRGRIYTSFDDLPNEFHKGHPVFSEEKYTVYEEKKSGLTRAFLPALLWANEALIKNDPDYVMRLKALSLKQQKALLYGDWNVFEGQFFSAFSDESHIVKPFSIPPTWRRYVGIDYGFHAPFAAIFAALGDDNVLYIYRELYASKLTPSEQAKAILDVSASEKIEWFAADPSMFSRGTGHGESHADYYQRAGLYLLPSNNSRVSGWGMIHDLLQQNKIKIFDTCPNLIRTLPALTFSRTNPDDLDTNQEDHGVDALRYLVVTLKGAKPRQTAEPVSTQAPDWWYDRVKNRQRKAFRISHSL